MIRRLLLAALITGAATAQTTLPAMGPLSAGLPIGEGDGMRGSIGEGGAYIWQQERGGYRFQSHSVAAPSYSLRVRAMSDIAFDEQRVTGAGLVFGVRNNSQDFWALVVTGNQLRVVRRAQEALTVPLSTGGSGVDGTQWTDLMVEVTNGTNIAVTVNGRRLVTFDAPGGSAAGGVGIFMGGAGTARFVNYDQH